MRSNWRNMTALTVVGILVFVLGVAAAYAGGGHGDYHPPTGTTDTTHTDTTHTDTTPTETHPTVTTPTTPSGPRCPDGQGPYAGKDGEPGNDECCPDTDGNQQCDVPVTPPTQPQVTAQTTTATVTTAATETAATPTTSTATQAKPKPHKPAKPVTVIKVTKKGHGVVVIKTSDGKTHKGVMGSG